MGAFRFAGPFAFALSIPALFYGIGPSAPLLMVAALLAALIGAEIVSQRGNGRPPQGRPQDFRWLPKLYIPVQLAIIVWGVAAAPSAGGLGFAALALSIGVTTGVFGVLAAHELVHGHDRGERLLGLLMLTGMSYRHFRVAHIYGHHRHAATENDAASARLGEGFYRFLIRTLIGQFAEAWRFERQRLRRRGGSIIENRIARDVLAMALVYLAVFVATGSLGAAFLAAESAVAILVLELFNYIAHYGLARAVTPMGRAPFTAAHSWNSSNAMANALIFNMGRHSWHHARPDAPYESLQWVASAPELPAGYAGSILLALVPPMWRRIMDPAVQKLHTRAAAESP